MRAYTLIVHNDDDGSSWAEVEELPGWFASGQTLEGLEEDAKGAIEQHLSALKEMGEPVPDGIDATDPELRRLRIVVAA